MSVPIITSNISLSIARHHCTCPSCHWSSSSFEPVLSNHCLAALDLGAGVEKPFDGLIVQNRQAMQSMGRSMDWTLEDTWSTVCSSAPHSQAAEDILHLYKQEWKRPTPVRRRLSRTYPVLGRAILWGWVLVMKVRSL